MSHLENTKNDYPLDPELEWELQLTDHDRGAFASAMSETIFARTSVRATERDLAVSLDSLEEFYLKDLPNDFLYFEWRPNVATPENGSAYAAQRCELLAREIESLRELEAANDGKGAVYGAEIASRFRSINAICGGPLIVPDRPGWSLAGRMGPPQELLRIRVEGLTDAAVSPDAETYAIAQDSKVSIYTGKDAFASSSPSFEIPVAGARRIRFASPETLVVQTDFDTQIVKLAPDTPIPYEITNKFSYMGVESNKDRRSVATLSPDATRVITAGVEGNVRIFPVQPGENEYWKADSMLVSHQYTWITSANLSQDGSLLAVSGSFGTVRVYRVNDIANGDIKPILELKLGGLCANSVTILPDNSAVAVAYTQESLRVFSLTEKGSDGMPKQLARVNSSQSDSGSPDQYDMNSAVALTVFRAALDFRSLDRKNAHGVEYTLAHYMAPSEISNCRFIGSGEQVLLTCTGGELIILGDPQFFRYE